MKYTLYKIGSKYIFANEVSVTYSFHLEDTVYHKFFSKVTDLRYSNTQHLIEKLHLVFVLETDQIHKEYIQEHFPELYI